MMLPTHALTGMALALPVVYAFPEVGGIALVAGFVGGAFPDLDLYVGHRRTLHFPVYYSVLGVAAVPLAMLNPTALTVVTTVFLLGAAVHSAADSLGGGLELRPWEGTSDRAVYDHFRNRWIPPRRWVRYDGAPEDLLLALAIATPLLLLLDGPVTGIVLSSVAIAVGYALVRRRLPTVADLVVAGVLVPKVPEKALAYVPRRYLQQRSGQPRWR